MFEIMNDTTSKSNGFSDWDFSVFSAFLPWNTLVEIRQHNIPQINYCRLLISIYPAHFSWIQSIRCRHWSMMVSPFGTAIRFALIWWINTAKMINCIQRICNCVHGARNVYSSMRPVCLSVCGTVRCWYLPKVAPKYPPIRLNQSTPHTIRWRHSWPPIHFWWAINSPSPIFRLQTRFCRWKSMHRSNQIDTKKSWPGWNVARNPFRTLTKWMETKSKPIARKYAAQWNKIKRAHFNSSIRWVLHRKWKMSDSIWTAFSKQKKHNLSSLPPHLWRNKRKTNRRRRKKHTKSNVVWF